ncbi:MAG TPA: hypothetical protein VIR33_09935 [Thermopolyspora sp.]
MGADVVPGHYVCRAAGNGRWIRYPAGNTRPVAGRPDTPGEAEVVIEPSDIAFQSHMPGDWHRIGNSGGEIEPIFDPELDLRVIRRLRANPDLLRHVRTGSPWPADQLRPRWGGWLRVTAMIFLAMLLVTQTLGVEVSGLTFLALASVSTAMYGLRLSAWHNREGSVRRVARVNAERFCIEADFDETCRALLGRAQAAIRDVRESAVARAGLLDPSENAVTLAQHEWQIALTLRKVTRLRADQRAMAAGGIAPEAEQALRPLRATLDEVVSSVTARVEALERYAARTAEADIAFHAHAQVAQVARHADEYRDLLAETAADELAVTEIDHLAGNAAHLERALHESLEAAQRAGVDLPDL